LRDPLSQQDLKAVQGLEEAYTNALDEHQALVRAMIEEDEEMVSFHDSLYHYNDNKFDEHHNNYSHGNSHDDHHHDTHGMHMENVSPTHHRGVYGHHLDQHEFIDELRSTHDSSIH
jgi:hypothetical protein